MEKVEAVDSIKQFKYLAEHYSAKLAITKSLTSLSALTIEKIGLHPKRLYRYNSSLVCSQLSERYEVFINQWNSKQETPDSFPSDKKVPAWTCWLQGEDRMPPLVKRLMQIQKKHLTRYQHTVITLDNVDSYIDLPGFFYDKFNTGAISPAQFTDILRAALLKYHGGLWLDATLLLTNDLPLSLVQQPYYTIKKLNTNFAESYKFPEVAFWEGYFIGGQRNSLLYRFMYDFFCKYWSNENRLLHYLLINQIAQIGITHIETLQSQYQALQPTNASCELLSRAINENKVNSFFDQINDETYVYKLSRHTRYPEGAIHEALAYASQ